MTVVFDDPELYRQVKIRAAEEGVPVKVLIERAVKDLLVRGRGSHDDFAAVFRRGHETKTVDWEEWDRWQAEIDRLDARLGPGPTDLSDVKHYLYGYPKESERTRRVAEEDAQYDR